MPRSAAGALLLSALLTGGAAYGQASYLETFDAAGEVASGQLGPAGLISRGWVFRRQASPASYGTYVALGNYTYEGAGALYVDSSVTQFGGSGAMWAVLPPVAGQMAGDPLSFWVTQGSSVGGAPLGRLQVRYSPSGGTSTGSGPADVGDFSVVLLDLPGLGAGEPWNRRTATVPGNGRIALRFYQAAGQQSVNYVSNFRIDSLRVGAEVFSVPLPAAGQTVHWTAAMSPITLPAQHLTIPQGGTVIVDPGASVALTPGYRLDVRGTLDVRAGATVTVPATANPPSELNVYGLASFTGTLANPVRLLGGARDWAATTERIGAMPGGKITASYVTLNSTLSALNTGVVVADHVTASGAYTGFFTSGQIYTPGGTIAVRDSVLSNGAWINLNGGYLLIDRTTLDNAQVYTGRYRGGHTIYFNNIVARNHPDSCFHLTGYDHFFGPNNVIQGNGFPVHLYGAGIATGSVLPTSGNANNMVHAGIGTAVGRTTFAQAGIAYRIDLDDSMPDNMGGSIDVQPGVTMKMGPGAYIAASFGSVLNLEGTPESPITFERLDPAQAWTSLWFAVSHVRPRVQDCVIRGAQRGADCDESVLRLESSRLEGNAVGGLSRNFGLLIARDNRFLGNGAGLQSSYGSPATGFGHGFVDANGSEGKPNWFEGNTAGLSTLNPLGDRDEAVDCYWGSPTGPTDPTNPGGTGDAAPGPNLVVPFLETPPDIADHPPIVRLREHAGLMDEGDKVILHWTARDEGPIAKFRIYYSAHGENPGLSLLIDNIPGDARSWEVVVPEAPPASNYPDPSAFRVAAVDEVGQEGYDEMTFVTPWLHDVPERITPGTMPALVRPGEQMSVCLPPGNANFDAVLSLDADHQAYSLGGTNTACLSGTSSAPPISTDLARVMYWRGGAGGRTLIAFSNYFSIRPDPAIGDQPPAVSLLSPEGGQALAGGTVVPISWAASDDESLRSFEIQASYNGGRTWHTVVDGLPGSARSFDWRLPPSTGIADVRVRVVAMDLRFQSTSAGADRSLAILPGQGGPACDPDFNADGNVDQSDISHLVEVLAGGANPTGRDPDFNRDGNADQDDLRSLVDVVAGGACP